MSDCSIKTKEENGTVTSHLYLATAAADDSGKYTCAVGKLARAKLSLHILNGERPSLRPRRRTDRPLDHCNRLTPLSGEEPAAIQSSRAGMGRGGDGGCRGIIAFLLVWSSVGLLEVLVAHFAV